MSLYKKALAEFNKNKDIEILEYRNPLCHIYLSREKGNDQTFAVGFGVELDEPAEDEDGNKLVKRKLLKNLKATPTTTPH